MFFLLSGREPYLAREIHHEPATRIGFAQNSLENLTAFLFRLLLPTYSGLAKKG